MSDLKDEVKKTVDDVKDAADEAKHRSLADIEMAKRKALQDQMTAGEKMKSGVDEFGHRVAAEVDKTKRDVRDKT